MATWAEFESRAPDLADFAARLWPGIVALNRGDAPPPETQCFAIAYLASLRRDTSPRIHAICPILAGGRLFAAIPRSSQKGWDLRRDPRCTIHALPGPDDDELCIRGAAAEVTHDLATRDLVSRVVTLSGVAGMIESASADPLFEFELIQVDVARWLNIGQHGTRAIRLQWRDG